MRIFPAVLIISALALAGCNFGRVNQGRVVQYDEVRGLITLVSDSNHGAPSDPRYDVLPPVTIETPEDRAEMGPEPEAGCLLGLDWAKGEALTYDERAQSLLNIPFRVVEMRNNVRRDDPLVTKQVLPQVDLAAGTVTVYSAADRTWAVLAVPAPHLEERTWKFGDEVRYYYKDPERALRLMNVTKTDVFAAGH